MREMVRTYIQGVCWVMHYYYEGVASWSWFYPYHYAPFASDLVDLTDLDVSFPEKKNSNDAPFKPFNQLMGVLPAASKHCLPKPYQVQITNYPYSLSLTHTHIYRRTNHAFSYRIILNHHHRPLSLANLNPNRYSRYDLFTVVALRARIPDCRFLPQDVQDRSEWEAICVASRRAPTLY